MRPSSELWFVDLFFFFFSFIQICWPLRIDHTPYSCLSRFSAFEDWWEEPKKNMKLQILQKRSRTSRETCGKIFGRTFSQCLGIDCWYWVPNPELGCNEWGSLARPHYALIILLDRDSQPRLPASRCANAAYVSIIRIAVVLHWNYLQTQSLSAETIQSSTDDIRNPRPSKRRRTEFIQRLWELA